MKRIILVIVLLLFALNLEVEAQNKKFVAPADSILYGVYQDGTFFITKKLVDAVEGNNPKVMFGPDWRKKDMKLSKDEKFYYFKSGRKFAPVFKVDYCFDIGGNRFVPHALSSLQDDEILKLIKWDDIVDNQIGGYNLRTKPLPVPK